MKSEVTPPSPPDIVINGKVYPFWQKFVHRQDEWIGGILEDRGDSMDRAMGAEPSQTKITGITLKENGPDSAYFTIEGEEFSCGADVAWCGIIPGEDPWLTFSGYGGHTWRIKKL
jgi:hypothetical protein